MDNTFFGPCTTSYDRDISDIVYGKHRSRKMEDCDSILQINNPLLKPLVRYPRDGTVNTLESFGEMSRREGGGNRNQKSRQFTSLLFSTEIVQRPYI